MIKNLISTYAAGYLSDNFDKIFNIIFGSLMNKDNDKIGFLVSGLVHSLIIFVAIGIPSCFQPNIINIPNIIPIEILHIDEITRIPDEIESKEKTTKLEKKNKKEERFSKSEETEIIKAEKPKEKIEEIEIIKAEKPKEKIIEEMTKVEDLKESIEEDKEIDAPVLEKKPIIENEYERLPSKDIKPKIKPKLKPKPKIKTKPQKEKIIRSDVVVKIKPKPKIDFSIASVLKDLRKEKIEMNNQDKDEDKIVESEKVDIVEKQTSFSISEIDLLKQQLKGCWTVPAGVKGAQDMQVKVRVLVNPDKTVSNARILDTNRMQSDPYYRTVAESTLRAVLNPACSPLKLPDDKYEIWKKFVFVFELGWMLGN